MDIIVSLIKLLVLPLLQRLQLLPLFENNLSGGSAASIFLYRDSFEKAVKVVESYKRRKTCNCINETIISIGCGAF